MRLSFWDYILLLPQNIIHQCCHVGNVHGAIAIHVSRACRNGIEDERMLLGVDLLRWNREIPYILIGIGRQFQLVCNVNTVEEEF